MYKVFMKLQIVNHLTIDFQKTRTINVYMKSVPSQHDKYIHQRSKEHQPNDNAQEGATATLSSFYLRNPSVHEKATIGIALSNTPFTHV